MTENAELNSSVVMDAEEINRAITRVSHQILENHTEQDEYVLIGILTRGDVLAQRIAQTIDELSGVKLQLGALDISFYRDDFGLHANPQVLSTDIPFSIDGKGVVLIDDVLFTGRTVRAALDALSDIGRPAYVQLAVLVDRGHRELPIRADYVGKNVPSSRQQSVRLFLQETDGYSAVELIDLIEGMRAGSAPIASNRSCREEV